MRLLREWWLVAVAVVTMAIQWGVITQKVYALDKDRVDVVEVRERLSTIEALLLSDKEDKARIHAELIQIRQLLLKAYGNR